MLHATTVVHIILLSESSFSRVTDPCSADGHTWPFAS